jgi:carboxypeptidase family protein
MGRTRAVLLSPCCALLALTLFACDGAPGSPTSATVEPSPAPSPPAIAGHALFGRITATPQNEPVAGALVEALHGGQVVQSATTDAAGEYSVVGLPAQDYVIRTIRTGYNAGNKDVTLLADTRLDVVMDRNRVTIEGFVSRADPCFGTLEGVRVEILDGPDAGKFDVSGFAVRYRIQGVAWGTFRMRASKPGYTVVEMSVTVPPPAPIAGATFTPFFRLVDQTGKYTLTGEISNRMAETAGQINDAQIEITRGPNTGQSTSSGSAGVGNGIYRFANLLEGIAYLQVSNPGFVTEYQNEIQLCGDWRIDFKLTPTNTSLVGVVRDENSAPLAGARVETISQGGPGIPTGKFAITDTNGQYTLTGIYGTFAVRVSKTGYLSEDRTMTTGPHLVGNFTLKKAP